MVLISDKNKNTYKDILKIAIPAILEFLLYMIVWLMDTIFLSRYGGSTALSATGICIEIINAFIFIFITNGLSISLVSLISRYFGAKKQEQAEIYASLGVALGLVISLICTIFIFIFNEPILNLAGLKGEVLSMGKNYISITCFAMFFNMMLSLLCSTMRGYGNTKIPMILAAIVVFLHTFLAYFMIFGIGPFPELGVSGAAIATLIGYFVSFLIAMFYVLKYSKVKIKFKYLNKDNFRKLYSIIRLCIPASLQETSFSAVRLLMLSFILHLGTTPFAANSIVTNIESLSFMPGFGFAVATTALVGMKIGEGNIKEAKAYVKSSIHLSMLFTALIAILFLTCPKFLIGLFMENGDTVLFNMASQCLFVAAFEQIFVSFADIFAGAIKATGDTRTPFLVTSFACWLIRFPLSLIFIFFLKWNVVYAWIFASMQWIVCAILYSIILKKKFKHLSLKNTASL